MLTLETERLLLRPFVPDDVDALLALVGDPEVMRFIGTGEALSRDDAARWIDATRREYDAGMGKLAIERRADGRFLGRAGFWSWDTRVWAPTDEPDKGAELELGWALVRSAWGSGYATEAAGALRDHAFGALGWRRLISMIHPENARSRALAERLGAVAEEEVDTLHWGPALVYVHRPAM